MSEQKHKLLEVKDLKVSFFTPAGEVKAVGGISYDLDYGEVMGVVGESGSGKSQEAYSIMGLLQSPGKVVGGSITFEGQDVLSFTKDQMTEFRGSKVAMIFQNPMTCLNPVYTIGNQLVEALRAHDKKISKEEAEKRAMEMMEMVGINNVQKRMKQYPHEFSGGMRQRVMIAMGLICHPQLLIADEPTNGLDEAGRTQFFALLDSIFPDAAKLIITHDISVAARCDRVLVLCGGRMLETGVSSTVLSAPRHPYTKALLAAQVANGMQPSPVLREGASGCPFYARCPKADEACLNGEMQKHTDEKTEWWCCHA